ncbi:hypothetical protein [Phocaeicola plebeius]
MGYNKRQYSREPSNRVTWRTKNNIIGGKALLDLTIEEEDVSYTEQYERQKNTEAVDNFNRQVMNWGESVKAQLIQSIDNLIDNDRILSDSLNIAYRHWGKPVKNGQEITSLGFHFVADGIYVHLGVGAGYNMQNGTRILTKKTDNVWRKQPKHWFNPVIERNIPALEKIVTDYCGKLIINTLRININI